MYLFVDTEFTDFRDTDLISLGIVSEDGQHEFYVEITDHTVGWQSQFVREAIVPMLDYAKFGKPYDDASVTLKAWIENLPDGEIVLVVDYMMDVYLVQEMLKAHKPLRRISFMMIEKAFMGMLHERGFHYAQQHSIAFRELTNGMEEYFEKFDKRRHHALVDAKANRYGWLEGLEHAKRA